MSALTPLSFIDDGRSFTKRTRRRLDRRHIAQWLTSSGSDTSAYTGSFFDDGADMLMPIRQTPGFGAVDARFYAQRKKKEDTGASPWNVDVQRAVSGDVQRNLAKVKGLAGLEARRSEEKAGKGEGGQNAKEKEKEKGSVTIRMPRKWGTFVIKADDGQVIVVDPDGEFDSGPQGIHKSREETRWVRAASSTAVKASSWGDSSPGLPPTPPNREHVKGDQTSSRRSYKPKRKKAQHKNLLSPPSLPLSPITESAWNEDGSSRSSNSTAPGGKPVASPTEFFFMSGGASGWPSRTASSAESSVRSATKQRPTRSASPATIPWTAHSPIRSLPGSWPSPPLSPIKSAAAAQQSWGAGVIEGAWEEEDEDDNVEWPLRSHSSQRGQKSSRKSPKSQSTYKAPTVEDAPDSSPERTRSAQTTNWGGTKYASPGAMEWHGDGRGTQAQSSWSGREAGRSNTSTSTSTTLPLRDGPGRGSGAAWHWDGYERRKTSSEVSVAGTGSSRSWVSSRASSASQRQQQHSQARSRVWSAGESWSSAGTRNARVDDAGGEEWTEDEETESEFERWR